MYILKETTKWPEGMKSSGVYIFEQKPKGKIAKAVGYISHLSDEVKWFSIPLDIDLRHRRFVEVHNERTN